ncbi:MAG: MFS transporter [bacterium]
MIDSSDVEMRKSILDKDVTAGRPTLLSRPILAVFAASFGAMMSFYMLLSVVPQFAASVGATGIGAGFATGALMLSTVLAELGTPALVSRFGYRLVIVAGLLLLGLPAIAMGSARTVAAILALCIVRGVGVAILVVLGGALVASLVPDERRGEGLGLYGFVVGVPAVIGLPLGLWLAEHAGYHVVFLAGGLVALAGIAAAPLLPGRKPQPKQQLGMRALFRRPEFIRPSILFSLTTMAAGAIVTFLPMALVHASGSFVAIALLVQAAAATMTRWWAGARGDRHGSARLLVPAILVAALGILALLQTSSLTVVMIGMGLFGAGFGVAQNASLAVMFERASPSDYDSVSALWNLAYDAGLGIGAAGFGVVAAQTGYAAAFGVLAAMMLAVILIVGRDRSDARRVAAKPCVL